MEKLLEELKSQPETIKPEQKVEVKKPSTPDGYDAGGGHCQGGGSW